MKKKIEETELDSTELAKSFDAGVASERKATFQRLTIDSDNFAESYCKALFEAACDQDGVFWLSVDMQGKPSYQIVNTAKLFRQSKKFNISQVSPYRVTRKGA